MKMKTRNHGWRFLLGALALVSFCFVGCSDDDEKGEAPYDPGKPVVITDFTPKEGGVGSRMVIYGENFGNDPSRIKIMIGGKESKVIGVKNQSLHCFVPARAFDGDIEITMLNGLGEEVAYAEAPQKFVYQKKTMVSTFLGETYENNTKYDVKDGPFNDCGGFSPMGWMIFDPNDHNLLFVCGNNDRTIHRIIDFGKKEVRTHKPPGEAAGKCNVFGFSAKGELIVVRDVSKDTQNAMFFFDGPNYQNQTHAMPARGNRAAALHPNGEIYTSRYDKGWIGRYDPETGEYKMDQIALPYSGTAIWLMIHPTGKYMYITFSGKHIIMRSNYDEEKKTFTTPYLVCGKYETSGWEDGVGGNARVKTPVQGTFVKNPEYAGKEDQYDYYFCDKENHCIRILTPDGKINTFAGRPNGNGTPGYNDGALRTESRFKQPVCIVYDEERESFFIGDTGNFRIRKIALEE